MIKLWLELSDVIHPNENNYAYYHLNRRNFSNFWLISFCIVMKKQKLLLWPQVPFKIGIQGWKN